jgi:hypothetical protein
VRWSESSKAPRGISNCSCPDDDPHRIAGRLRLEEAKGPPDDRISPRERGTQRARQINEVILPLVPRMRSRRGEPSHESPGACDHIHSSLRSSGTDCGSRRDRYDPTTCKAHTHLAHDRLIGDCRIAGDHRDWNLDCSRVTNLHSHSVTQRGPWNSLSRGTAMGAWRTED